MSRKVNEILSSLKRETDKKEKEVNETRGIREYDIGLDRVKQVLEDNMEDIARQIKDLGGYEEREVWDGDIVSAVFIYLAGEAENLKNDRNALKEVNDILEDIKD